jgi:hypothetical protein
VSDDARVRIRPIVVSLAGVVAASLVFVWFVWGGV